jgi:[acyl-carrier-protein] S-malonyltransferase
VVSGTPEGVKALADTAKTRGAKMAVLLPVSGAFHSPLMDSAVAGLREAIAAAGLRNAAIPILANVDGKPMQQAADIAHQLLKQIISPVQWVNVIGNLPAPAIALELGSGKVLTGLIRRINPNMTCLPVSSPPELEKVRQLLQERS